MAMTALERKRRQLEKREALLRKMPESTERFQRRPFFEFFKEHENAEYFMQDFDAFGMEGPDFADDSGPTSSIGSSIFDDEHGEVFGRGSVGRAEHMVDCLLQAAKHLAQTVNEFKTEELNARIAELQKAELTDPEIRKQALADIVTLNKILDELSKSVRWTLPQWKVKGD